jgi:hypothetical protein
MCQSVECNELVGWRVSQSLRAFAEKLVAEARVQFRSPEEGEHSLLEAIPRRLVKTQQAEKT